MVGAGISGNKVYDLYLRVEDDVLAKDPGMVVIYVGINDVWHKTTSGTGTDLNKYEKFYIAIIKKLQAKNIKVAVKKENDTTRQRLDYILELFPDLKRFWKKPGGLLSGGQKQMLSIARAYVNDNELLLIDEPSKGLAPIVVEKVMESIQQMKEKTTIILVEQNFMMASTIGDSFYIIDDGRTVSNGAMDILREDEEMRRKYLGIA